MKSETLQYPPTMESINHTLLEPFLEKELKVSYALGDGSIESCKGSLEHHHKFTILGEHEGDDGLYILRWTDPDGKDDEAIMNISEPFDQEDGTQSLIVTDGIMGSPDWNMFTLEIP